MSGGVGLGLQLAPKTPISPRPATSYSGFQLPSSGSSQTSDHSGSDDDALPFPTALSRQDFLPPDFHAAAYLSSLFPSDVDTTSAHRHQTLEDLRSELRDRSAAISTELLELVNANYTSFLGLGDELKGGEDRVEDVRVALLGFRRAVEDINSQIARRKREVSDACDELGAVRHGIERARRMLELDERVGALEARLAVDSLPKGSAADIFDEISEEDDDDEDDELDQEVGSINRTFVGSNPTKLLSLSKEYLITDQVADLIGRDTPFVKQITERMQRCRNTLLLDLNTATKEARSAGPRGQTRILKFLTIYRLLSAEAEAVGVFKKGRRQADK